MTAIEPEHAPIYHTFPATGHAESAVLQDEMATGELSTLPAIADYSDHHVQLCGSDRTLTIHHFLLTHPKLVIPLSNVIYILPAQKAGIQAGMTTWGTSDSGVAWARDLGRLVSKAACERGFVCKYRGAWKGWRVGFSVEDRKAFLDKLEELVPGITTRALHDEQEYPGSPKLEQEEGNGVPAAEHLVQ